MTTFREIMQETEPRQRYASLLKATVAFFELPMEDLMGRRRTKTIALARQTAMYLLRSVGLSLSEIGAVFSRDHTTVLHGIAQVQQRIADDARFAVAFRALRDSLAAAED